MKPFGWLVVASFLVWSASEPAVAGAWWKEEQAPGDRGAVANSECGGVVVSRDQRRIVVKAGATANSSRAVNAAHGFAMAAKAARVLAYERLAEVVNGVSIDGASTFRGDLLNDSRLRTAVKTVVHGAEVIREEFREGADGSPWVEVTLSLQLVGDAGLDAAVQGTFGEKPEILGGSIRGKRSAVSGSSSGSEVEP